MILETCLNTLASFWGELFGFESIWVPKWSQGVPRHGFEVAKVPKMTSFWPPKFLCSIVEKTWFEEIKKGGQFWRGSGTLLAGFAGYPGSEIRPEKEGIWEDSLPGWYFQTRLEPFSQKGRRKNISIRQAKLDRRLWEGGANSIYNSI